MKSLERVSKFLKVHEEDFDASPFAWDNVDDFVDFISRTLIPDLYESGMDATAEDFEHLAYLLKNGERDPEFEAFLRDTLIPDLKESGTVETAEDFETGLNFLEGVK